MKIINKESGFTLPELLISMVIMSILSLALALFIVTWLQQESLSTVQSNLINKAELSLDKMTQDIQLSGSANANNIWADSNGPGGDQYGWTSSSDTLVLAKVAVDKTNNVIFTDPKNYISQKDNEIYYLQETTLYRRTLKSDSANDGAITTCPPASATLSCPADLAVATGVTSMLVQYYDNTGAQVQPDSARSIKITLNLKSSSGGQTISTVYSARMVFRND